jgi:hypothetical protein
VGDRRARRAWFAGQVIDEAFEDDALVGWEMDGGCIAMGFIKEITKTRFSNGTPALRRTYLQQKA